MSTARIAGLVIALSAVFAASPARSHADKPLPAVRAGERATLTQNKPIREQRLALRGVADAADNAADRQPVLRGDSIDARGRVVSDTTSQK